MTRFTAFLITVTTGFAGLAWAQSPAAGEEKSPKLSLKLSGFYEFNGYTQNNFFFGARPSGLVTDHDDYAVQLLRLQTELGYGQNVKAVLRVDYAQGIWGIDDQYRDNFRPGFSNLYNNKDTNFTVHVDWAYVEFNATKLGNTVIRVGRMKNALGNLLVLDQDGDGVQVSRDFGGWNTTFSWTKMYEGADALTDNAVAAVNGKDADLFYLNLKKTLRGWDVQPYLAYYTDRGWRDNTTYIPNELEYFNSRFRPNVTTAHVAGFAFSGKAGKLSLKGEVDYLWGKDKVRNRNSGPNQLLDVNNGDLEGYNLYLDAKLPVGPTTLGAVFGLGSGDDDLMSGKGNINKIRTNGFFYVTEIWEDSIMPDEEGITPQGLGSPASRGYRELENTTLVQLNATFPLAQDLQLFVSGTLIRATEALHPWSDLNGNNAIDPGEFGSASSRDLGKEVDFKLDWKLMDNLVWTLRGGYFWPGDAALYLINGNDRYKEDAWELRTQLNFSFGGKVM
ncbi:MAG: alginate export family protein [Thermoanaerobaculaceae bacterium]